MKKILLSLVIWALASGLFELSAQISLEKRVETGGGRIFSAAISPDQKIIASTGEDMDIVLWNAENGQRLNALKGHSDKVLSLAFSPNGQYLVSGGKDQKVIVWSVKGGTIHKTLMGHQGIITSVTFSPNDEYVLSADQNSEIKVWDFQNEKALRSLTGHQKEVTQVAFHPEGKWVASSSLDKTVKIWDVNQGQIVKTLDVGKATRTVDFSPNGLYLATGSDDKVIRVWDATLSVSEPLKELKGHKGWVQSLGFSSDSRYLVSGAHDEKVIIWDVEKAQEVEELNPASSIVMSTSFASNGAFILSATLSNKFSIWDSKSLKIQANTRLAQNSSSNNTQNSNTKGSNMVMDLNIDLDAEPVNYLLLIGVSDYSEWAPLPNAVKDVKDIKKVLQENYKFDPENTYELYDAEFTNEKVFSTIESIRKKVGPMDNLLIYYSGHGHYDPTYKEGYWVPSKGAVRSTNSYFSNTRLITYLKAMNTRHTFVVADACFSGALFGEQKRGYIENVESINSRWGLTSGNLESVSDGKIGENSPFAHYFMKFLADKKRTQSKFPVSELIQYVKISVANNSDQTPVGSPLKNVGHEGGEFVFHPRNK